ncbi:PLDc N-terminal domain-containing protein [Paraflavitalea pollutisoli]|uniref:PLDc N-terminal domain-containing protein n=1 Tax=Paraflavitalea pollutisoli TaxID=3034143 RepID=UPI0023EB8237|nr:PLDc N-terminal domain-containing protein [Paraflavitalea sp. H1-2-19X]
MYIFGPDPTTQTMFPFFDTNFYYITGAIQVICVIHCIRKGNQQKWIWIIVFLPLIGGIAYIFTEMFSRRDVQQVQANLGSILNPTGTVRKLEENLRFSDTFNNRMALADAYLATGETSRALDLYEGSYTGAFTENEDLLKQLIIAYSLQKQYEKVIPLAKKLYKTPSFARSKTHILYAIALEHTGNSQLADQEFKGMNVRFSYFEARYEYAQFLQRAGRAQEARDVLKALIDEAGHLSPRERSLNRQWIGQAKEELRRA